MEDVMDFADTDKPSLGVPKGNEDDQHHSLPVPEEIERSYSRVYHPGLFILAFLVVTGVVLGLSLGLTSDNRKGSSSGVSTIIDAPPASAKNDRTRRIRSFLVENGVSSSEDLLAAGTPQAQALEWIAHKDERRMDIPEGNLKEKYNYEFVSRYVTVVLYYALGGRTWNRKMLFLSEHHTCEWFFLLSAPSGQIGVLCDYKSKTITGYSFIPSDLEGSLPSEVGVLTSLTYLESIGNAISGPLPDTIQNLKKLETLSFPYNQLSNGIPNWIGTLTNLEFLYLSHNLLSGVVPDNIEDLQELKVLGLDDNNLSGPIEWAWKLPRLTNLYLEKNSFVGLLPTSIKSTSPDLVDLDLSDNELGGNISPDLFGLDSIEIIDLHNNEFFGPIPPVNTDNDSLEFLALYGNQLSTSIPPSISKLKALTHLDLSSNLLTNVWPNSMGDMESLTHLFLSNNSFMSLPIPEWVYYLTNLKELSLKGTFRNGRLSTDIGRLTNLIHLDLDNNDLRETLPSELGKLEKLQYLLLNRNGFTGDIPQELESLEDLRLLFLDRTSVQGSLQGLCPLEQLEVIYSDCSVSCDCCECCVTGADCHEDIYVANIDPQWETDYQRNDFVFSKSGSL